MKYTLPMARVQEAVRYLKIIDGAINARSKDCAQYTYDRNGLKHVEQAILEQLEKTINVNTPSYQSMEDEINSIVSKLSSGDDALKLRLHEYMTLYRILYFKPFHIVKSGDNLLKGVLKRRSERFSYVHDVTIKTPLIVPMSLSIKSKMSLLEIEWRYIAAMIYVKNASYVNALIDACPLNLLISIKTFIERVCLKNPDRVLDKRRLVEFKYKAKIGEEEVAWTGRGRMPHSFRDLFEKYGEDRFKVDDSNFSPEVPVMSSPSQ